MRQSRIGLLLTSLLAVVLAGCASSEVRQGGARKPLAAGAGRVFLAPIYNATPDETAGRAITELAATTLLAHGVPLAQTEDGLNRSRALIEEGKAAQILDLARSLQCTHVLLGTVTEYRYKSDLDGSPIVSITMRLADATDGSTVWQGTSTKMTQYFGSLSRTAQEAMSSLAQQMSGKSRASSRTGFPLNSASPAEIEAAARNVPPGSSHIPASAFRKGKYEPDPEQILRRGGQ